MGAMSEIAEKTAAEVEDALLALTVDPSRVHGRPRGDVSCVPFVWLNGTGIEFEQAARVTLAMGGAVDDDRRGELGAIWVGQAEDAAPPAYDIFLWVPESGA